MFAFWVSLPLRWRKRRKCSKSPARSTSTPAATRATTPPVTVRSRSSRRRLRAIEYKSPAAPAAVPIKPAVAPASIRPRTPLTTPTQPIARRATSTAASPIASANADSAAKSEWPRNEGCRRPAAHASAMSRPKICSRPTNVATTLQATTTPATTSHCARRLRIRGSDTASSAYSANFVAVTRCVSDCERAKIQSNSTAAAIQSASEGRSRAKPSRRPSRNATAATTTTARSDSSSPRCVDPNGTRTPG
jgi:hypothetical protein